MTWTYDPTDLSTDLAKVRLLIGDTDTNDQLLSDEEINHFLTVDTDPNRAAAFAANAIYSKFARLADTTVESVSKKYSQKAQHYSALAKTLEAQANSADAPSPGISGINPETMRDKRNDTDRVREKFYMDRFSNPNDQDVPYNGAEDV